MDYIKANTILNEYFNRNTDKIKKEILKLMTEPPSRADKSGWVYGFCSPKDKNMQFKDDFWIKIGRTERNDPYLRVDEWGGELLFCFKSSFNHRLERLLHLFFSYAREQRKGICDQKQIIRPSFYKYNTNCLCFLVSCWFRKKDKLLYKDTQHKEIEWFHFKEPTDVSTISSVIMKLVEELYNGTTMTKQTKLSKK